MKKYLILLLFLSIFLSACSGNSSKKDILMDQLGNDGKYHYSNGKYGFSVDFPEQFIYFQTQRKDYQEYVDFEFFVPIKDTNYPQLIPDYGKFLTIRVYKRDSYDKTDKIDTKNFIKLAENNNKVYLALFWDRIPDDWRDKWQEKTADEISSSFKIK